MPLTKSAKKALRQNKRREQRNKKKKEQLRETLKEIKELAEQNKIEKAKKLLPQVYKVIDKSRKAGLIKKNTASRKKSEIARMIKTPSKKR